MNLSELEIGDEALIRNVHASSQMKNRLMSFGIIKNEKLTVENISLNKKTIGIIVEKTAIALRHEEAKLIEVDIVQEIKK